MTINTFLYKVLNRVQRIRYFGYRCCFRLVPVPGKLLMGKGNKFLVPVSRRHSRGTIYIGNNNSFGNLFLSPDGIILQARDRNATVKIGNKCLFSNGINIVANLDIELGDNVLCGDGVIIFDSDFHGIAPDKRLSAGESRPVKIGNNVWLGSRVMVLKNVIIGDNSIIAPGSIVTKDIPANVIAAGIPAVVKRNI